MPRSSSKANSTASESRSLGLSSFHERHRILEEEHQWLLKQIKRKRSELKNFLEQMQSLGREIAEKASPIYQQMIALDSQMHFLFEEILTKRKWGKKSLKELRSLYQSLQLMGLLSPKFDGEEEEDRMGRDSSNQEYSSDPEEDDFSKEDRNARDNPQGDSEKLLEETQIKSPPSRSMRETFLKLASMFHPDKVTDNEKQEYHNEMMKEVNRAYEEGDIARLLEIERQHHLQEEIELNQTNQSEIERKCHRREKDNQLLKEQYEKLKKEVRIARKSPEGEIVKEYRACQKEEIDMVSEMVKEMESQIEYIESIRDFVRDFRDKKITLKEFLAGPAIVEEEEEEEMEEMLEMMLGQLLGIKIV